MLLGIVSRAARAALLVLLAGLALLLPKLLVDRRYLSSIYRPEDTPKAPVAIVFGAGLRRDGRPTAVLSDRVRAAADLYHAGAVAGLLMSGTQDERGYDEPGAMRQLALELGVPAEAVSIDGGGTRTFLTCWRARQIFGIQRAILVSQRFHLPRALAICDALGISAAGTAADLRTYNPRALRYWQAREVIATAVAMWETRGFPLIAAVVDLLRGA